MNYGNKVLKHQPDGADTIWSNAPSSPTLKVEKLGKRKFAGYERKAKKTKGAEEEWVAVTHVCITAEEAAKAMGCIIYKEESSTEALHRRTYFGPLFFV